MGAFRRKDDRQPVTLGGRVTNIATKHYRGILSFVWAIVMFGVFFKPRRLCSSTLLAVWLTMLGFFLIRPMPAGATALIPIFSLPMLGILSSDTVCRGLVNENVILFFLGNWLLMLLNNCGLDKRVMLLIMGSSDAKAYTPEKMMLKACMAGFTVSAIAERDLAIQQLLKYVTDALGPLKGIKGESNYGEMSHLLVNAIAVSSYIGSMTIMYSSLTTIQLRSLFSEAATASSEFPDLFNFLNYSAYAIPTCIVMFILNTGYEVVMISRLASGPMSVKSKENLQKSFKKYQQDLGPMTNHEKVCASFLVVMMALFFTRWSNWLHFGWATHYKLGTTDLCGVKDATLAAMFVVLLHFLPKSLNFFKIWCAQKEKDMPVMKKESGILFWHFVDSHTDYSLFILFGTGSVIYKAIMATDFPEHLKELIGEKVTGLNWNVGVLIVVLVPMLLCNLMTGMAAQALVMPIFLSMAQNGMHKWPQRRYLIALGVGLGSSLGFCSPFKHTPNYFVKTIGKMELKKQIMYSVASVVICALILWVSLCFYAPLLWDHADVGILPQEVPGMKDASTTKPKL